MSYGDLLGSSLSRSVHVAYPQTAEVKPEETTDPIRQANVRRHLPLTLPQVLHSYLRQGGIRQGPQANDLVKKLTSPTLMISHPFSFFYLSPWPRMRSLMLRKHKSLILRPKDQTKLYPPRVVSR